MVFHRLRHVVILTILNLSLYMNEGHAFATQISGGYVTDILMIMTSRQQNATVTQVDAETMAKHIK